MSDDTAALILALAVENAELHARIEELQADLVEARLERDAWTAEAERGRKTG